MSESAMLVVLAAPLLVPLGYGLAAVAGYAAYGQRGIAEANRHGLAIYAVSILGVLACVVMTGLAGPEVVAWLDFDLTAAGTAAWLVVAVVAGVGLYRAERCVAILTRRIAERDRSLGGLLDGATGSLAPGAYGPSATALLTVVIVVCEELLWRGVLVHGAREHWGMTAAAACASSGAAFGVYHYFFGLRGIVMKGVHGCAWAALLVVTGSLLAPIVSHLTFNACAMRWRPPRRRAAPRPQAA